MALQHLYSNVPTKMSMFNKMDGYDTFACSDGVTYETIEKDLAVVLNYKMSKTELDHIREGSLSPLYCQFVSKSGSFVQSCISFQPKDYTGEKSSYFVHSLIYGEDEAKKVASVRDVPMFNRELMKTDLDSFSLNSPESRPDNCYPELAFESKKKIDISSVLDAYDRGMIKRTIYALLNAACGKGKDLYILLSDPERLNSPISLKKVSETGLEFINAIIQIVPFSMRPSLSFATYLGEPTRYPFKVKFITPANLEIPTAKGITLNFVTKAAVGLPDETVAANGQTVEFFYSLISNDELRDSFLTFIAKAVEKTPELAGMNFKTLSDLVTLFMECSGQYGEYQILPNDDVLYDYVCTYEKNRESLDEKYRASALRCLSRYSVKHYAIPKNVFAKIGRIYPKESRVSKRTVMNTVLDLIHTDLMRDKLFSFIKANYDDEEDEIKARINEHLTSVYYGGFLQPQLLEFFTEHFATEPVATQDLIVEKMVLTVRNPSVRDGVLAFFESNRDNLTAEQKKKYYDMMFDQLSDCDEITEFFIDKLNVCLADETPETVAAMSERVCACVEKDCARKNPMLLGFIMKHGGACADAVTSKMMNSWSGRKIFDRFASDINALPFESRVEAVFNCVALYGGEDREVLDRLAPELPAEDAKVSLYALIGSDRKMSEYASGLGKSVKADFIASYLEKTVRPQIIASLPQAFDMKVRQDGVEYVGEYAAGNDYITSCEEYSPIKAWTDAVEAMKSNDRARFVSCCADLARYRAFLAFKLKAMTAEGGLDKTMYALITVLYLYFEKNKFRIADASRNVGKKYAVDNPTYESDFELVDVMLKAVDTIVISDKFKAADTIPEENGELFRIVDEYIGKYQKKSKAAVKNAMESGSYSEKIMKCVRAAYENNGGDGFFARLFGKKK